MGIYHIMIPQESRNESRNESRKWVEKRVKKGVTKGVERESKREWSTIVQLYIIVFGCGHEKGKCKK